MVANEKKGTLPTDEASSSPPLPSASGNGSRKGDSEDTFKGYFDLPMRALTWTPKKLRYDPKNPPQFTMAHNCLYAFAATFTAANLYYNQPVLNKIADTFDVTYERASSVATLMQAGYASGLLFICPLGDIIRRRPFALAMIWLTSMLASPLGEPRFL
ncbi:major facilitator superfamily transporter [Colletotrichum tofieldiae]|nr:major facilitator superfamily transporter [Colletotrichum tofieldiae]GKT81270.1 major facilitator superfamily transporter [Colletotrichum tofieldiae]GKT83946.1 major facilitator superfamily transporter [Colletotrichum tofieldiae]